MILNLKVILHGLPWLNSNVECGLLFLDNRPLRSKLTVITDRCHEKKIALLWMQFCLAEAIQSFLNQ